MPITLLLGLQWGDEGKGKMVDLLSADHRHVVRSHGGANAGHTLVIGKEEFKFHLVPSGILYPQIKGYLSGGVVVDPEILLEELDGLAKANIKVEGRFFISLRAHMVLPYHKILDLHQEKKRGDGKIGTTGKGIGPCYTDKVSRMGITFEEFLNPIVFKKKLVQRLAVLEGEVQNLCALEDMLEKGALWRKRLQPFGADVEHMLAQAVAQHESILLEGAHGSMLDVSYGTYPFVTSSGCIAAAVLAGAGLGPMQVTRICGVIKAYTTRVGSGELPTAFSETEQALFMSHDKAREIGTTTGRLRRMGWFDVPLVKRSIELSGVSDLVLSKLDILDDIEAIKICTHYLYKGKRIDLFPLEGSILADLEPCYITLKGWRSETAHLRSYKDLPAEAKQYINTLQELLHVPIKTVFVGPDREQTVACP